MKKVIIIFGNLGLIGGNFFKYLSKKKQYKVIGVDLKKISKKNYFACNALNDKELKAFFSKIKRKYKRIDSIINAAYPRNEKFSLSIEKLNLEDFNYNLSANVGLLFNIIKYSFPILKKQNYGSVINIGSIYGNFTPRYEIYDKKIVPPIPYSAIKAGQNMLMKHFASYCVSRKINIRFNTVSPGGVYGSQSASFKNKYKKFSKFYGMIQPEELNGLVELLISDQSKTITGQNISVDDGFTL